VGGVALEHAAKMKVTAHSSAKSFMGLTRRS